jgi:hypothetical protein
MKRRLVAKSPVARKLGRELLPFGYLIVFSTLDGDIRLTLDGSIQAVPFVEHNKRTIFVLTINIFTTPTSASKRGALSPIATIDRSELIRIADTGIESHAENTSPAQ